MEAFVKLMEYLYLTLYDQVHTYLIQIAVNTLVFYILALQTYKAFIQNTMFFF